MIHFLVQPSLDIAPSTEVHGHVATQIQLDFLLFHHPFDLDKIRGRIFKNRLARHFHAYLEGSAILFLIGGKFNLPHQVSIGDSHDRHQQDHQIHASMEEKGQRAIVKTMPSLQGHAVQGRQQAMPTTLRSIRGRLCPSTLRRRRSGSGCQIHTQWDEHQGHKQGSAQCDGNGQCQAHEEKLPLALDQGYRKEHDHCRQSGHGDGEGDFSRTLNAGVADAHAILHEPINIFGNDNRIIHQKTDTDHQPQDAQHVEGLSREIHHREGNEQTHGYRQTDNQGKTETPKKEIKHQGSQHATYLTTLHQIENGRSHHPPLIEKQLHVHAGKQGSFPHLLNHGIEFLT